MATGRRRRSGVGRQIGDRVSDGRRRALVASQSHSVARSDERSPDGSPRSCRGGGLDSRQIGHRMGLSRPGPPRMGGSSDWSPNCSGRRILVASGLRVRLPKVNLAGLWLLSYRLLPSQFCYSRQYLVWLSQQYLGRESPPERCTWCHRWPLLVRSNWPRCIFLAHVHHLSQKKNYTQAPVTRCHRHH